jgi:hypothetical protein
VSFGDGQRVGLVGECGHRQDRPEDFFLEDPHLVVPLEHGWLEEVAVGELAAEVRAVPADQDPCAFLLADLDIGRDLRELLRGVLRAHHGLGVQRVALLDLGDAVQAGRHELVIDALLAPFPDHPQRRSHRRGQHSCVALRRAGDADTRHPPARPVRTARAGDPLIPTAMR